VPDHALKGALYIPHPTLPSPNNPSCVPVIRAGNCRGRCGENKTIPMVS
jgi:hypothetical protein